MGMANGTTVSVITKGKVWNRPRDGKEFIGVLVGGYHDTRKEIISELWKRYGIKIVSHFGLEKRREKTLVVRADAEICVILTGDVEKMIDRVLVACKLSRVPHIGITRKQHTWDATFAAMGFANPPRFRDGMDVDKPVEETQEDIERQLKRLEELEKPIVAYVDPKLAAPKLAEIVPPELIKAVEKPTPPAPVKVSPPAPPAPARGTTSPVFAKLLREARLAAGYSQGALGKKINTHQTVVSKWESVAEPSLPLYETYLELRKILPTLPDYVPGMMGKAVYEERMKAEEAKRPKVIPVPPPNAYAPPMKAKEPPKPESVKAEVMEMPPPPPTPPAQASFMLVASAPPPPAPVAPAPEGETLTVNLKSGGTLTLNASVNAFRLSSKDRAFLFELIDKMREYEGGGK